MYYRGILFCASKIVWYCDIFALQLSDSREHNFFDAINNTARFMKLIAKILSTTADDTYWDMRG